MVPYLILIVIGILYETTNRRNSNEIIKRTEDRVYRRQIIELIELNDLVAPEGLQR